MDLNGTYENIDISIVVVIVILSHESPKLAVLSIRHGKIVMVVVRKHAYQRKGRIFKQGKQIVIQEKVYQRKFIESSGLF